jgi:hypothetical protein
MEGVAICVFLETISRAMVTYQHATLPFFIFHPSSANPR